MMGDGRGPDLCFDPLPNMVDLPGPVLFPDVAAGLNLATGLRDWPGLPGRFMECSPTALSLSSSLAFSDRKLRESRESSAKRTTFECSNTSISKMASVRCVCTASW